MNRLIKWFDTLDTGWRVILAIIGIFMLGLTTGAATTGVLRIPSRVTSLEQQATQLTQDISTLKEDVKSIRASNDLQNCLEIAAQAKTDYRKCLVK